MIVGPTAVGKTSLCVSLAKRLSTVVVSADSRQFYQEMAIGTAKPTEEEMQGVKHYFVGHLSIHDDYNAGQYERDAIPLLDKLFQKYPIVVLTGGSGMYIDAVCYGIDEMPEVPEGLRASLNARLEKEGLPVLLAELQQLDPAYFDAVDRNNPRRVVRGLEVCLATGKPYSAFRASQKAERSFDILKIGVERDRAELYERINHRMDLMLDAGLVEEAEHLYPYREKNALKTVGYRELFGFMSGLYDYPEAVRLLKKNSRNYAKRQMTWFRKDLNTHWVAPDKFELFTEQLLQTRLKG